MDCFCLSSLDRAFHLLIAKLVSYSGVCYGSMPGSVGLASATAAFIGRAGTMPGSVRHGVESATAAFIGQAGVMPGSIGLVCATTAFIERAGVMPR